MKPSKKSFYRTWEKVEAGNTAANDQPTREHDFDHGVAHTRYLRSMGL
jgi:hypothetical protein